MVSLGPMHRAVFPVYVSVSFLLGGCATAPELFGPLSANDVRDITALVESRSDIRKPIMRISADRHDRATVETGRDKKAGDISQRFTIARKHGSWRVVSRIDEEKIIIAGTPFAR